MRMAAFEHVRRLNERYRCGWRVIPGKGDDAMLKVIEEIEAAQSDAIEWRHHLHSRPELQFDLQETSAFVEERLREFGIKEVATGIAKTGVVAVVEGREQTSGRMIGLRADMDALPIMEMTGLEYASRNTGQMHACGHDGHTTMLLAAARYLAANPDFDGRVVLIFQPAEELGGGGRVMIEDGLFKRWPVDQVFGMHTWPGLDVGRFSICPGPMLAASGRFDITIRAKGGHAAFPHKCIDPIVIARRVLDAFDGIMSRETDPLEALVVSTTKFEAGHAYNVISASAKLGGTIRALSNVVYDQTAARMQEISRAHADLYHSSIEFDHTPGYPALVNDEEATRIALSVAQSLVGMEAADAKFRPIMGSEDFAFMLKIKRGAFIAIGQGDGPFLHHPQFDFNDEIIPLGASYWCRLVQTLMPIQ